MINIMEIDTNPCIRCGKERIKEKEQTVLLGAVKTRVTTYVCPDKECQKHVDKSIAEKEEKKLALITRNQERANNRHTGQKIKSPKS